MNVIRRIEISEEQAEWLDSEIANGNISNEREFISDLLTEAKLRLVQSPLEIAKIRALLDEADIGGNSPRKPDEFWNEILATK